MGGGNGAKAASKRARNQDKAPAEAKSQLKINEAAKDIQCEICKSTFLKTTRAPALQEHATNKHNKTLEDSFPGFVEIPKKGDKDNRDNKGAKKDGAKKDTDGEKKTGKK